MYNTYGSNKKSIGSGYPVWLRVDEKETSGGVLEVLPKVGEVLPAGTLVEVDGAGGTAKVLDTYEVAEAVTADSTSVKVYSAGALPQLREGTFVMKAPATVDAKGKAVAVTGITDNGDGTSSFTITAGGLGTLVKGDILVGAVAAGASVQMYCVPTGLTENDVVPEIGDTKGTVASVYHGQVMADRIQPVPQCVKDNLPQIKFQTGV